MESRSTRQLTSTRRPGSTYSGQVSPQSRSICNPMARHRGIWHACHGAAHGLCSPRPMSLDVQDAVSQACLMGGISTALGTEARPRDSEEAVTMSPALEKLFPWGRSRSRCSSGHVTMVLNQGIGQLGAIVHEDTPGEQAGGSIWCSWPGQRGVEKNFAESLESGEAR